MLLTQRDLQAIHDILAANHPGPVDPQSDRYRRRLEDGLQVAQAQDVADEASAGARNQAWRTAGDQPLAASDETLLQGMKFYINGCAGCHGDGKQRSTWGTTSFFPRVPQFGTRAPSRPDWQIFWIAGDAP